MSVRWERLRGNIKVERVRVADVNSNIPQLVFGGIVGDHQADDGHQSENQENFTRGYPAGRTTLALGHRALVELGRAPENENQRPPVPEEVADLQVTVIVEQQQKSKDDQKQTAEDSGRPWPGWVTVRHGGLLPLSRVGIGVGGRRSRRRGSDGRSARAGRNGARGFDVTVHRSQSRSEKNDADYDKQHREGMADVKIAAADFTQQKQDADGGDHDGAHQVADGAARACATDRVGHLSKLLLNEKLRASHKTAAKHV